MNLPIIVCTGFHRQHTEGWYWLLVLGEVYLIRVHQDATQLFSCEQKGTFLVLWRFSYSTWTGPVFTIIVLLFCMCGLFIDILLGKSMLLCYVRFFLCFVIVHWLSKKQPESKRYKTILGENSRRLHLVWLNDKCVISQWMETQLQSIRWQFNFKSLSIHCQVQITRPLRAHQTWDIHPMLVWFWVQRRRWCPNIKLTLGQRLVLAGLCYFLCCLNIIYYVWYIMISHVICGLLKDQLVVRINVLKLYCIYFIFENMEHNIGTFFHIFNHLTPWCIKITHQLTLRCTIL